MLISCIARIGLKESLGIVDIPYVILYRYHSVYILLIYEDNWKNG